MRIHRLLETGILGGLLLFSAGLARPSGEIPSGMTSSAMEKYQSGEPFDEIVPAETFGYPSPLRVLELAGKLDLTAEQEKKIRGLANRMSREAALYGKKIIAHELLLDDFFRKGQTDPMALANRVESIGLLRWRLRFNLLSLCVNTRSVLTAEQLQTYRGLRSPSLGDGVLK
ncbi:MAG: hypothetical protein L0Z48_00305 [candidate division Zixibacteria bacterium]|nr:hypothetical protein [candidate division Zixibacteria bacterium]MCI0594968.1 hypothetical protein [candidate division Zixibacteria bacterium]